MKYYIYISDAKVDMLYPQIPKSFLKRIASDLSIDLKIMGSGFSLGTKNPQTYETRYAKVKIVSEYIEKHLDVGNMDAPSAYFKDTLSMQWGRISSSLPKGEYKGVYFSASSNSTTLGLFGSIHHVIGNNSGSYIDESGSSSLYLIENLFKFMERDNILQGEGRTQVTVGQPDDQFLKWVKRVSDCIASPKQRLEFLAKTLIQGPLDSSIPFSESRVVLGTPIYVAIDD